MGHEASKIFTASVREDIEAQIAEVTREMERFATIAKEVGGDVSQSTTYMGYEVIKRNLEEVLQVVEGRYTYNMAAPKSHIKP